MPSARLLGCAAAVAAIAAISPGQAAAKGVFTSVRAGGPAACVTITDPVVRVGMSAVLGRPAAPSPRLGAYLRLTTRPADFDQHGFLVPGQGMVQLDGIDHRLGHRAAVRLRSLVAGLTPYRPRVADVWVGGRAAPDPAAYAALLRRPPVAMPAAVWNDRPLLMAIGVAGRTPWSGWGSALYFPRLRVMHVPGGSWVRLTAAQARIVAAVAPAPAGAGSGLALAPLAALAAAAAGVTAGVALGRRHQRRAQAV